MGERKKEGGVALDMPALFLLIIFLIGKTAPAFLPLFPLFATLLRPPPPCCVFLLLSFKRFILSCYGVSFFKKKQNMTREMTLSLFFSCPSSPLHDTSPLSLPPPSSVHPPPPARGEPSRHNRNCSTHTPLPSSFSLPVVLPTESVFSLLRMRCFSQTQLAHTTHPWRDQPSATQTGERRSMRRMLCSACVTASLPPRAHPTPSTCRID